MKVPNVCLSLEVSEPSSSLFLESGTTAVATGYQSESLYIYSLKLPAIAGPDARPTAAP